MQILVADPACSPLRPADMEGMHHLRYRVFRERLHWDIPTSCEKERDHYDECRPVYVLARGDREIVGCCRLLRTTGPYMLKDTFPALLGGREPPMADDIWEISRFAVTKDARHGFGFTEIPSAIIRELVRHALRQGINHYVFVTTVAFERLLRRMGIHLERFAEPMQVGIERSVALWMYIDRQTIHATQADCGNDPHMRPQGAHGEAA
jgi:acyl homoserine lactone synthase